MSVTAPPLPIPPDDRVRANLRDLYEHYDKLIDNALSYTEARSYMDERRAKETKIIEDYWL